MEISAEIRFEVNRRAELSGAAEIIPAIDGEPLTSLIHAFENDHGYGPKDAYGGIVPSIYRFGPLIEHYCGRSEQRPGAKVPLLGCGCGEWGCWPLLARVETNRATVEWSEFEQPFRQERNYSGFGPFVFSRLAYDSALNDLKQILADSDESCS